MKLFPIEISATDKYGWADSPELAKSLWLSRRDKSESWYGVDLTINSFNSVTISVRKMKGLAYGGIGDVFKTLDIDASEFTDAEQKMFDAIMMKRYNVLASEEYDAREREAERNAILKIRKEMFGV